MMAGQMLCQRRGWPADSCPGRRAGQYRLRAARFFAAAAALPGGVIDYRGCAPYNTGQRLPGFLRPRPAGGWQEWRLQTF